MPQPLLIPYNKKARIYHRLSTGLQLARNQNGYMRFMTLTTARTPLRPLKNSFDILRKRILRATKEKAGFTGFKLNRYFCLRTSEGNGVLHIIYWTSNKVTGYIPQSWLSSQWYKIHGAFIADIRACSTKKARVNGLVNYLLRDYIQEQPIERMSYGWRWAWLGFCRSWRKVKEVYRDMRVTGLACAIRKGWTPFKCRYRNHTIDAWQQILWNPPLTSRQTKITKWAKI